MILRNSSLAPFKSTIALLALLCLAYIFIAADEPVNINLTGPLFYSAIMAHEIIHLARRDRSSIMTPLFAYYAATGLYFGIGAVAPLVTNAMTREYMFQLGEFGGAELLKVNLITTVFTLVVIGTVALYESLARPTLTVPNKKNHNKSVTNTFLFAIAMLCVGMTVEW